MNARKVAVVGAVWLLRWMLDIVLVFVQLGGAFVASVGATRIYYAASGRAMTDTSIAPDQAIFYVGAIALGLATWARWELKK